MPSMRHSWLLCLPLAASLAPVDQIKTLLKLGRIDGATGYHELDSGFCNSVYRVDTHKKPVVVKIYSAMAKARCAPACRGVVDEAGATPGPKLVGDVVREWGPKWQYVPHFRNCQNKHYQAWILCLKKQDTVVMRWINPTRYMLKNH